MPGVDLRLGLLVVGVEAAHKADHRHELRMLARHGLHALAGGHVQRQRLLDEDMLAGLQRRDRLLRVQRGRGDDGHRLHLWVAQQRGEVVVYGSHAELALGPRPLALQRAAGGHQACAARAQGQLLGMALAHAAKADDADVEHLRAHRFTTWPLASDCAAASASFCASTPSATLVRKGAPLCRHWKKCANSSR